ncbi:MAG: YceI family protein [Pseudomonadota bacterium]
MRTLLTTTALFTLLSGSAVAAPERYTFDNAHTDILFFISHFGFSTMQGEFIEYEGELILDEENPELSSISVTINTESLDTDHAKRDEHLKSADFFNVTEHPTITFDSTNVNVIGDNQAEVTGELTILGETRPVTLNVSLNAMGNSPVMPEVHVVGFDAETTINRLDFGMETFAPAIGEEVEIRISTELHRQ